MANKRLNASITIGGTITGALKSAIGQTRSGLDSIGKSISALKDRQKELNRTIAEQERLGMSGSALRVSYAQQELGAIERQLSALRTKQSLITQSTAAMAASRQAIMSTTVALGVLTAAAYVPLRAFSDLDSAMTNAKVAYMNATGSVPEQFETIKKQTIELGNILPGTTADFVNLATALKEQGMPVQAIVGGALKSAAHLSVVLKMVPAQAGEMVAKLREAFQLGEDEFEKMADYTQRVKFGFGLKSDDLLLGAKYYGGKLNALGITGAENVRKVYALQGLAAQQGMDGSTFGTNFSMMLTRVGLMTERLHKNSKEMRAVNATLRQAGISLSFFDKAGKFAGVDNMVAQLDKLKVLTQEKRLQVLTRIFGEEGGRIADMIARNGVEGYKKGLETMDKEANLDQRIKVSISSFKNQVEALTGTVTNLMAAIGAPIASMLVPVMSQANDIIGSLISDHGTLIENLSTGAATLGVYFGGWKLGVIAINGVIWAFNALKLAIATNPIGLALAVLTTAAVLVYKNWEPIKAFFVKLWDSIVSGAKAAFDWVVGKLEWVGSKVKQYLAVYTNLAKGDFSGSWQSVKQFYGVEPSDQTAALPGGQGPLPSPAMASSHSGPVNNTQQTNTFNITQQPGQDSKALASEVARLIAINNEVAQRGRMYDPAMGY